MHMMHLASWGHSPLDGLNPLPVVVGQRDVQAEPHLEQHLSRAR